MPLCSVGAHRCAAVIGSAYFTVPGDQRMTTDRLRGRFCARHYRRLLQELYRRSVDLATELGDPEYCLTCGNPTSTVPLEVSAYEGDNLHAFYAVQCDVCGPDPRGMLGEAPLSLEKLPPRENSTRGSRPRGGRKESAFHDSPRARE